MNNIFIKAFLISVLIVLAYRFAPNIDQSAYQDAKALKKESTLIMQKASDAFTRHQSEVNALKSKLERIYRFQEARQDVNPNVLKLYSDLINDQNSLHGFFEKWQEETVLDSDYIAKSVILVENTYDKIIVLENTRLKETIGAYY